MSDSNTPNGIAEDAAAMSESDMAALIGQSVSGGAEESEEDDPKRQASHEDADSVEPEDELSFLNDEEFEEGSEEAYEEDDATDDEEVDESRVAEPTDLVRMADGTEMTVEDLIKGNLREADYTRNKQKLADERRETEALTQRVKDAESKATQDLQTVHELISSFIPAMPNPALANPNSPDFDMVTYQQQRAEHEYWSGQLHQVNEQIAQRQEQQQQEQQAQFDQFRNSEAQKLFEKVPALKSDKNLNAFFKEAGELLSTRYGIPGEELQKIPQHQFWLMAKDLMRLNRMDQKRMKAVRKGKGKPRVMKAGHRESAGSQAASQQKGMNQRIQRVQKTGKANDAVLAQALGQAILKD